MIPTCEKEDIEWLEVQTMLYWANKLPIWKIRSLEERFKSNNIPFDWKDNLISSIKNDSDHFIEFYCKMYCEEFKLKEDATKLVIPN